MKSDTTDTEPSVLHVVFYMSPEFRDFTKKCLEVKFLWKEDLFRCILTHAIFSESNSLDISVVFNIFGAMVGKWDYCPRTFFFQKKTKKLRGF